MSAALIAASFLKTAAPPNVASPTARLDKRAQRGQQREPFFRGKNHST
jgi:hypothetical protein